MYQPFFSEIEGVSRLPTGLILSAIIAGIARARKNLSTSGAVAAVVVATACTVAGWSWAILLIAFFVSSSFLSKVGEERKRATAGDIVEKGGARDAWQVLANGGLFASLAIASLTLDSTLISLAAAGALATSTADTWATELGTLSIRVPRGILSGKPVAAGTSGGVTLAGTVAALAGAAFIAIVAVALGWPARSACGALAGGFGGSTLDSLLGATLQGKRWCSQCERGTERAIHTCGTTTVRAGGLGWLGNDLVNFISSIGGALLGSFCLL